MPEPASRGGPKLTAKTSGVEIDGDRPAFRLVTEMPASWTTYPEKCILLVMAGDSWNGLQSTPGEEFLAAWAGMPRSSLYAALKSLCAPTAVRPALLERVDSKGRPLGDKHGGRVRTTYRFLFQPSDSGTVDQSSSGTDVAEQQSSSGTVEGSNSPATVQQQSSSGTVEGSNSPATVQQQSSSGTLPIPIPGTTPNPPDPRAPEPGNTTGRMDDPDTDEVLRAIQSAWHSIGRRDLDQLRPQVADKLRHQSVEELTLRLTRNPGGVREPMAVLRTRIRTITEAQPSRRRGRQQWCGQCESDEHRWIEYDNGKPAPCPRCSPQAQKQRVA